MTDDDLPESAPSQLAQGFVEGSKDLAKGTLDLLGKSGQGYIELAKLGKQIYDDPEMGKAIWDELSERADAARQAMREYDYAAYDDPSIVTRDLKNGALSAKNAAQEFWNQQSQQYQDAVAKGQGARYIGQVLPNVLLLIAGGASAIRGGLARLAPSMARTGEGVMPCAARAGASGVNALSLSPEEANILTKYQSLYDEGYASISEQIEDGDLPVPKNLNPTTFLGQRVDAFARVRLQDFANGQGYGTDVMQINQRLYLPDGSGYRVPDVYFPQSGTIFDGTIGTKTATTPQIVDFGASNGGAPILIIRPTSMGGTFPIYP